MARRLVLSLTDDARAFRRAVVDPAHRALGRFLESGVGATAGEEYVEMREAAVAASRGDSVEDWFATEAFTVHVAGATTTIECDYDEDLRVTIATEDFLGALEVYAKFVDGRGVSLSGPVTDGDRSVER